MKPYKKTKLKPIFLLPTFVFIAGFIILNVIVHIEYFAGKNLIYTRTALNATTYANRLNGITVFPQKFPYLPSVTINRKIKLYRLQNPV